MYSLKRDRTTYDVMYKFCTTLGNIGLAPYGVTIIAYDYFVDVNTSMNFCFTFWEKEDCE